MLQASEFRAQGGLRMLGHGHPGWHLCVVLDGGFEECSHLRTVECGPGAVRLSRPGATHDLQFDSRGAHCLIIEAAGPFWSRVLARPLRDRELDLFRQLHTGAFAESWPQPDRAPETWLAPLLKLFDEPGTGNAPQWVEEARREIECGSTRALSAMAHDYGVNREAFADHFRQAVGLRPAEHRTLTRVSAASRRLRETDQPLAELALDCGFTHQSHMTNAFRTVLGTTPGKVRASA